MSGPLSQRVISHSDYKGRSNQYVSILTITRLRVMKLKIPNVVNCQSRQYLVVWAILSYLIMFRKGVPLSTYPS